MQTTFSMQPVHILPPKFLQKCASVTSHPGQPLRQGKTLGGSVQGPKVAGPVGQRPALGAALGQTLKRCGFCNCCKKFRELHHCVGPGPLFATWGGNCMFRQGLLMGDETLGGMKAKNACKGAPGAGLLAARSPIRGTWPPTSLPGGLLCLSWPGCHRSPPQGPQNPNPSKGDAGFHARTRVQPFSIRVQASPAAGSSGRGSRTGVSELFCG